MGDIWYWGALAGLGAFHGINPAMGWLFAVARGLQEGRRDAVWRALVPIALGHAAAVAAVVAAIVLAQAVIEPRPLRLGAAGALLAFGLYRLVRGHRQKVRAGMQAGFVTLTVWSFFMATGHGAGLMVAPVLLGLPTPALHQHASPLWMGDAVTAAAAVAVHMAAMLLVTGVVAVVVYDKIGLAVLRRGWINFDLVWAAALLATGLLLLVL